MKNPLRDEASAFQVVLLTLGGAVLVAVAAWINTWLGLAVFLALVGVALWAISGRHAAAAAAGARRPRRRAGAEDPRRRQRDGRRRASCASCSGGRRRASAEDVLVVCPALNSKLQTWTSDEDGARAAAQERLDASLARLRDAGVDARGEIGDGDPLQALEDALRVFPADEIVVSTHPPGRSHWLEQGVVEQARLRFDVPVTHVVVDLGAAERVIRGRS